MTFSKKNLTTAAIVVIVLGVVAYFLFMRGTNDAVVTAVGTPGSEAEATFLGLASELETVSFDGSIFTDPRFTSLRDIHTNIIQEPVGRRDPFAQLSGVVTTP